MNELFYFPTFDLLIKVIYAKAENSLRYVSHRALKVNEKKVLERYILQEIAPKTEYYQRTPSLLFCMGVDSSLQKELKAYQIKDTIKTIMDRKHDIDEKVQDLILSSLSSYYFDRLGDKLLSLRRILEDDTNSHQLEQNLLEIQDLLNAYNQNSGQAINIESILPRKAIEHYHQLNDNL